MQLSQSMDSAPSSSSAARPAANNRKIRESLSHAESALQAYAREWESKRQSMKRVKRKLLNRHVSTFGAEDMSGEDLAASPYLVFLSSDPQLHLAVRVYLPRGNRLKIGRAVSQAFSSSGAADDEEEEHERTAGRQPSAASSSGGDDSERMLDLQIDGLGIEDLHCILTHSSIRSEGGGDTDPSSVVTLSPQGDAVTYLNGKQLQGGGGGGEDDSDGFVLRRNGSALPAGGIYSSSSSVSVRRASRSQSHTGEGGGNNEDHNNNNYNDGDDRFYYEAASTPAMRGSATQLKGGDILVLGECSHVFVFVTPDMADGLVSGRIPMPSYSQAIREVILGRVESTEERKRRVATRVSRLDICLD